MGQCEFCGNTYENTFEIKFKNDGVRHSFDSFECAIEMLAPKCRQCGVKIVGHGVQAGERIFCCANCARQDGHSELVDHS